MPNMSEKNYQFYGIDGDKVGSKVEYYLVENKVEELGNFSKNVINALESIKDIVINNDGKVIFCAGDSILFAGIFNDEKCSKMLNIFLVATGCTASMGVGNTSLQTYLALKLAKVKGGGRIAYYHSIEEEDRG